MLLSLNSFLSFTLLCINGCCIIQNLSTHAAVTWRDRAKHGIYLRHHLCHWSLRKQRPTKAAAAVLSSSLCWFECTCEALLLQQLMSTCAAGARPKPPPPPLLPLPLQNLNLALLHRQTLNLLLFLSSTATTNVGLCFPSSICHWWKIVN